MVYTRYAIYHAPAAAPLAEAGAHWLGWDAARGIALDPPQMDGLPRPLSEITATPRKYGFHATIKAPFRLADGYSGDDLAEALGALAGRISPVTLDGLEVASLGDFVALRPVGPIFHLRAMAGEVVERLDRYRAPPTEAEIAKRNPDALSPRQRALLDRFGYPYVLEQFHMHLTLSGALPDAERHMVELAARARFAPLIPLPYVIGDLCLFGEAQDGRFHLLHRYTLTG